jgi:hypothetical protein
MDGGVTVPVFVNPLAFLEAEPPWNRLPDSRPDLDAVVAYACASGVPSDIESLLGRYLEISKEKKRLFAAPADETILEKLFWPLRHAKASYMFGNYLGTISLCGMVAEMVAILLFEMHRIEINGKPITEKGQEDLFGTRFENLGQDRRVRVLKAYGLIDHEMASQFDTIRIKRRRYLHFLSQSHQQLAADAVEVFLATASIVAGVIGQDIEDGKLRLNPALMAYLVRKGVVTAPGATDPQPPDQSG